MAQPTNTHDTYDAAAGIKEEFHDTIYNIDLTTTPFISLVDQVDLKSKGPQWQIDSLAAADVNNAVIEGDDATYDATTAPELRSTVTQISDKTAVISGTAMESDYAGRADEMAYQLAKKGHELRIDLEKICMTPQGTTAGNATTARKTPTPLAWITTNVNRGATGASGGWNGTLVTAPTDGTLRALPFTQVKSMLRGSFTEGGKPDTLMAAPLVKQLISEYLYGSSQVSTPYVEVKNRDGEFIASASVFVSDFGTVYLVPNIHMRTRDLLILDRDMWAIGFLRPFRHWELAKTGDSEKRQILTEWAVIARNEAASAAVTDIDSALAVV